MLTTLQTAYTDTRAGDLAWQLGGDPLPALAVRDLSFDAPSGGGATLQLRLLGASHQVVVAAGPGNCLETVACLPGRRTPLPARVAERVADWEYEFAARIEELPAHTFAARAQELLALVAEHPYGLAGTFPGDPCAFTALVAQCEETRVLWRTWHAYPQEGRLVCTRSSLVLQGPSGTGRAE
ncbi:DUF2617 family protein [Kitasatospora sp. KL5]|uniref:DUF2617 family protein n=1 Tax=Kitasatospora sp. KL5 TaxID=3425125 RepID=UPI003D6E1654